MIGDINNTVKIVKIVYNYKRNVDEMGVCDICKNT